MNVYGDFPPEHVALMEELRDLEKWYKENTEKFKPKEGAKGFTCMAHDWYSMEIEEEGDRLIRLAEKTCPGYFKNDIYDHMSRDTAFKFLVDRIMDSNWGDILTVFGFKS